MKALKSRILENLELTLILSNLVLSLNGRFDRQDTGLDTVLIVDERTYVLLIKKGQG